MNTRGWLLSVLALGVFSAAATLQQAVAHPPAILSTEAEKAVAEEIKDFRKRVADAIRAKDRPKLDEFFAKDFMHTHASGARVGRDPYLTSAIAGAEVIETTFPTDLEIRVPNDWMAVASGTANLPVTRGGKPDRVRWLSVYSRRGNGWVVVAGQLTPVVTSR